MCGVAGVIAFNGGPVSLASLKAMTDCMVQRGPDDDGFFAEGSVGLAFRRLSIIDVQGGHQPLTNEAGDLQLVLNGEIYNHVELRQQLVARGHSFRTMSDAETVLHLYEERGVECLAELNGMFAFALYDSRRGAVWVARDRLGIKPLFYAVAPNFVAFASDVRALRAAYPTDVDQRQVLKYLALGYVPGDESMWRGVRKLPPAHHMWIENGAVSIRRYWSVNGHASWRGSVTEAEAQLEALLIDAVRLQLRSDVPLGVFLSGGLDSSAIVALAAEQMSNPLQTFTISFEGKHSADERFSRQIAERYHTSHTEITMGSADAATAIDELLPMMDEPIADSAMVPAYWLSKASRERGIKVLLNGAGGDEIFAGYGRHWPARFGSPDWVANRLPKPFRQVIAGAWQYFQPDRAIRATDSRLAWAASVSGVNFQSARSLLRDPADYAAVVAAAGDEYAGLTNGLQQLGFAHARMSLDLETYLPEDVLALTDKATMAASVEGRVPLIDHRLVEFAISLPTNINFDGGRPKGLLKRVMANRLPQELLNRSKEGFNAPHDVWMRSDSGIDLAGELLDSRTPLLDELIEPKFLESLLANPQQRSRSASMLFGLFILNKWHRSHLAPSGGA
jgi:asparagine synthase (glutamine-hydrolysing)